MGSGGTRGHLPLACRVYLHEKSADVLASDTVIQRVVTHLQLNEYVLKSTRIFLGALLSVPLAPISSLILWSQLVICDCKLRENPIGPRRHSGRPYATCPRIRLRTVNFEKS